MKKNVKGQKTLFQFGVKKPIKEQEESSVKVDQSESESTKGTSDLNPTVTAETSKKQKVLDYNAVKDGWEADFKWLIVMPDGLYCSVCKKHGAKGRNNQGTWTAVPCTRMRRASCTDHEKSQTHTTSVFRETQAIIAAEKGGIEESFQHQVDINTAALTAQLKIVYWLLKEEIPHTTKYGSLISLCRELGCTELHVMQEADNMTGTGQSTLRDHTRSIGKAILKQTLLPEIQASPYFSLMIDETTDVAIQKQLIYFLRYITDDGVKTSFVGIRTLLDGKANTIYQDILHYVDALQLDIHKLAALGSDGANVMVGKKGGVSGLLRSRLPQLINIHCIAHRLALAAAQASQNIPYLKKFKAILEQLFYYYQNSAVRMAGLKEIQKILNDPKLKLKECKDVRWLSHDAAVTAVRKCFRSLIVSLSREASERHCATGRGLHGFIKTYKFIATIHMLSDVLPHLSSLSKIFQKEVVDFTMVGPSVAATLNVLGSLYDNNGGDFLKQLDDNLVNEVTPIPIPSEKMKEAFMTEIFRPYLLQLMKNIEDRFPQMDTIEAFNIFDPELFPDVKSPMIRTYGSRQLQILLDNFGGRTISLENTPIEWSRLKFFLAQECKKKSIGDVLEMVRKKLADQYPNMAKLAAVAQVLPMSTADCERGFSCMARIKTKLRNRMSNEVLQNCMLVAIEGPSREDFDFGKAVKNWSLLNRRRLVVKKQKEKIARKKTKNLQTRQLILRSLGLRHAILDHQTKFLKRKRPVKKTTKAAKKAKTC